MLFYDLLVHTNAYSDNNFKYLFYGDGVFAKTFLSFDNVDKIAHRNKFSLIWQLRKFIKKNRIDVVHSHTPYGMVYAFLATLFLPVKRVLTVHGSGNSLNSKIIFNLSFALSHRVLFVSFAFKKRLLRFLNIKDKKKFKVVYNGLNVSKFSRGISSSKDQGVIKSGMVGNFYNDVRDHLTVCKAAKILQQNNIPFKLEFVGGAKEHNTAYLDACVNYITANHLSGSVSFLGSRDDVDKLLATWDLFLYSSNRDSFGIAVIEAMFKGIPIMVNDLDVFEEITQKGKYATLYKTKDAEDLARKIKAYIQNPAHCHLKAKAAANYAVENFSIEKHVTELHKIYQELKHA